MTNLQWGNLGLTDIPSAVANLQNIEIFDLANNSFTSVPLEIQSLTGLQELYLSYNQISVMPEFIGNLSNLTALSFWHNTNISTLPDSLDNLTQLKYLDFDENTLLGNLGKWWSTIDSQYSEDMQPSITLLGQDVYISASADYPTIRISV